MSLARKMTRSANHKAERLTEEEVRALSELVKEVGILERKTNHARARLDAYALDLEAKYRLKSGDNLDADTGTITRRASGSPPSA